MGGLSPNDTAVYVWLYQTHTIALHTHYLWHLFEWNKRSHYFILSPFYSYVCVITLAPIGAISVTSSFSFHQPLFVTPGAYAFLSSCATRSRGQSRRPCV